MLPPIRKGLLSFAICAPIHRQSDCSPQLRHAHFRDMQRLTKFLAQTALGREVAAVDHYLDRSLTLEEVP